MFYNVDGKTDKPRWFKMPVDIFYDSYGDMKNTDDVQEIIDIYQEDGQDFFHEIGLLLVNSILYHSDRDNETYIKKSPCQIIPTWEIFINDTHP